MADNNIIWDFRPLYVFHQTPKETYDIIEKKYMQFLDRLCEVNTDPVTVFNPLKEPQLKDLELIREVSKVLQEKKEEDMRKAQAADEETVEEKTAKAEDGTEEAEKSAEDKATEKKEESTVEKKE